MERFLVFVIALVLVPQAIASKIQSRVCPLNEVYTECGSQCPRTCDNYKDGPGVCILSCFIGCQCIAGYVRNTADGTCCLEADCPVKPTQICPLNQIFNECGTACPLTCDNYKNPPQFCTDNCVTGCACQAGFVRNTATGACCLKSECLVKPTQICPLNEIFNECGTACPLTCDNYKNPPQICTANCVIGCACQAGYVRNTATGACCLKSECPARQPVCPLNQVYNTCGSACPLTCENYKSPPRACTRQCVIGCQCNKGFVKKLDGSCCLPEDCVRSDPCRQ